MTRTKPALTSLDQNENSYWSILARDGIVKGTEYLLWSQKMLKSHCALTKTRYATAMDDPVQCHAYVMVIWWTTNDVASIWKTGRSSEEAVCCCGGLGQSGKRFMHCFIMSLSDGRGGLIYTRRWTELTQGRWALQSWSFPNKTNSFSLSLPPSFLRIMLGDSPLWEAEIKHTYRLNNMKRSLCVFDLHSTRNSLSV